MKKDLSKSSNINKNIEISSDKEEKSPTTNNSKNKKTLEKTTIDREELIESIVNSHFEIEARKKEKWMEMGVDENIKNVKKNIYKLKSLKYTLSMLVFPKKYNLHKDTEKISDVMQLIICDVLFLLRLLLWMMISFSIIKTILFDFTVSSLIFNLIALTIVFVSDCAIRLLSLYLRSIKTKDIIVCFFTILFAIIVVVASVLVNI